MKLHYIYHSGFALETEEAIVIIDFYQDTDAHDPMHGMVHDRLLPKGLPIYVLSTHFHPDHFNPEVLAWKAQYPGIRYIFSKDILRHRRAKAEDATYIYKGETYQDEHLRITAFGSTDVGVSFLLDWDGKRIFHAGDLNNWHWSEESTPQEIRKAEGDYLAEVKLLQQAAPDIDIALFPVDNRMGRNYMRGAKQLVERIKIHTFVPMHFGENYADGNGFESTAHEHGCRFLAIHHRGETFEME